MPTLRVFECANVLQSAQRRRRIDAASPVEIAGELGALPVFVDQQTPDFVSLYRLAETPGLRAYDAAYLELGPAPVLDHPEQVLLAYVYGKFMEHGLLGIKSEAQKMLLLSALNLVECIAQTAPRTGK